MRSRAANGCSAWHIHGIPVLPGPGRVLRRSISATGGSRASGNWRGPVLGVVGVNIGDVVWCVNNESEKRNHRDTRHGERIEEVVVMGFGILGEAGFGGAVAKMAVARWGMPLRWSVGFFWWMNAIDRLLLTGLGCWGR